jgi:hypothetical protein
MGYECPVCATPQADARHLANHLAFTAVLGDEAHEAWLDEHAPGWADAGEAELAPRVAEHAPEGEFPQVFEDTAGGLEDEVDRSDPPEDRSGALFDDEGDHGHGRGHAHDHGHDHQHGHGIPTDPDHAGHGDHGDRTSHLAGPDADPEDLDAETREVLEEAREMTREMLADEQRGDDEVDSTAAGRAASGEGGGGADADGGSGEEQDG